MYGLADEGRAERESHVVLGKTLALSTQSLWVGPCITLFDDIMNCLRNAAVSVTSQMIKAWLSGLSSDQLDSYSPQEAYKLGATVVKE